MKKFLSVFMALTMVFALSVTAFAAPVGEATIDTSRYGSINIYKYDLTNAEKDGVWDSSYTSTGEKDEAVEALLGGSKRAGDNDNVSDLGNGQTSKGYAIKGVEFTYLKVAEIRTYAKAENGAEHVEVLYGFQVNDANVKMLQDALGLKPEDRYVPADEGGMYFYQSDKVITGLKNNLIDNGTRTKNILENYIKANGGTAMAETDANGHTSVESLPLGLYLIVETKVPEMVTDTTAPFFVSVPMTAVDGGAVGGQPEGGRVNTDGGTRWIYDITLYPKNLTGIPTLEKTLREAKDDTGKNNASDVITDGFAHTGTGSAGDVIEYQVISTLPVITSEATYLTVYSFIDKLEQGLSYNKNDVVLEFFRDADCTDKVATWTEGNGKFTVTYGGPAAGQGGGYTMTIDMTEAGLAEINGAESVYTDEHMVNSGYSDCTLRITYAATINSDNTLTLGDKGNENDVVLTWKRSNSAYYDTLMDDAHVYSYGIELTKTFSDDNGDYSKVEFMLHNDTDNYYVIAELNAQEGVYYVTDHNPAEAAGTHFIPMNADPNKGKIIIRGLEDDEYTLTEVRTDNSYTLLKDNIKVVIKQVETEELCDIYTDRQKEGGKLLGVVQNDPRFATVIVADLSNYGKGADVIYDLQGNAIPAAQIEQQLLAHPLLNMPQKHLDHHLLTASATVQSGEEPVQDVTMLELNGSVNAEAPLQVVNTHGFELPHTGGTGNWMFPVIGLTAFGICAVAVYLLTKKRDEEAEAAE